MAIKVYPYYNNFTSGLLSSLMDGRPDTRAYNKGLRKAENIIILPHGGFTVRGAWKAIARVKSDNEARLVPFVFSSTPANSYVLEFTNTSLRFHKNRDQVLESGVTITNATQADPVVITASSHGYSDGDQIKITGVNGMTELNGNQYLVNNSTTNDFELQDLSGTDVDGTGFTAYDSGGTSEKVYEITSPYQTSDLFNIRHAQSADFMYLVDGNHPPRTLQRSGDTDWILVEHAIAGLPFEPSRSVEWRAYTDNQETASVTNESTFTSIFTPDNQGSFQVFELSGSPGTFPVDGSKGIQFGVSGDTVSQPQFLQDYRVGNEILGESINLQITGDILISQQGVYDFGFNAEPAGEFIFGNDQSNRLFHADPNEAVDSVGARGEFGNGGTYTKKIRITDNDGADKTLTNGKQFFRVRLSEADTAVEVLMKFTMGWRYDADIAFTGSGTDIMSVVDVDDDDATWHGNKCFQIRVWIDPADGNKFGWGYREETDIQEFSAWETIVGNQNGDGTPASGGGIDISTNFNDTSVGASGQSGVYALQDSSGNFGVSGVLAYIYDSNAGSGNPGDYWDFKVGFMYIQGDHFQKRPDGAEDASYPSLVTIHENRLIYASSDTEPSTFWGSKSGDYDNFVEVTLPTASDSYKYRIGSDQVDPLQWMKSKRHLLLGGLSGEYIVQGAEGFITPVDPPTINNDTNYGGAFIDPVKFEDVIMFAERSEKRLRDYSFNFSVDGWRGVDNSILSYEMLQNNVKQMDFQRAGFVGLKKNPATGSNLSIYLPPINILWIVTDTGELKAVTYEIDHKVIAWHEHTINDGSVLFESIAAIPGPDGGDDIYAVIKDPDDSNKRWICYLDDEETRDLETADTEYQYQGQGELMPAEFGEGIQTTQGFVKEFATLEAKVFGMHGLVVALDEADFANNLAQTFAESLGQTPVNKRVYLYGKKEELTLNFETGLYTDPATDDKHTYPCTVLGFHGKVNVNEP